MAGSFAVYPGRSTLEEEYLESWFISFRSDYRLANIVRLQEGRNRTPRSRAWTPIAKIGRKCAAIFTWRFQSTVVVINLWFLPLLRWVIIEFMSHHQSSQVSWLAMCSFCLALPICLRCSYRVWCYWDDSMFLHLFSPTKKPCWSISFLLQPHFSSLLVFWMYHEPGGISVLLISAGHYPPSGGTSAITPRHGLQVGSCHFFIPFSPWE